MKKNFLLLPRVAQSRPDDKIVNVTVELDSTARDVIKGLKDEMGVAQVRAVSRILRWFAKQDRGFRASVINQVGDPATVLAKLKLAEMATAGTGDISGMSLEDALRAIKVLLDRVETIGAAYQEQLGVKGTKKG